MADDTWVRDPDTLERILYTALGRGDIKVVEAVLVAMVGCDMRRAVRLADELRDALAVARFLHGQEVMVRD